MPVPYGDLRDAGLLCVHCQRRKDAHHPVPAAVDGPAGPTLVCPTAVFSHPPERSRQAAARDRAEDSR